MISILRRIRVIIYKTMKSCLSESSFEFVIRVYATIFPRKLHEEQIIAKRCEVTIDTPKTDPMTARFLTNPPMIDVSVVTYNSSKWVDGFIDSILKINYPLSKISIFFVDSNSTDDTVEKLKLSSQKLIDSGVTVRIIETSKNVGYGAGNNIGIKAGKSEFCLITNIDLEFASDAIIRIVSQACADVPEVAVWELRQKPYEHPKFYDPVTGLTTWNTHACILVRRDIFENVGGYDETIFMYGDDVELSYRLRKKGYLLRYNPMAEIYHYTYDSINQIKPIQYTGSIFANLYIRLKYGNIGDILVVPFMMARILIAKEPFKRARLALFLNFIRLIKIAPRTLINRPSGQNLKPLFCGFDYERRREGAFVEDKKLGDNLPLVTIITRTYKGRDLLLRQALLSVAHQTYPSIEHIVVQDGGDNLFSVVDGIAKVTNHNIKFIGLKKCGRSAAGNAGLAEAKGKWCLFLDDDDLLFCDHIETLVNTLAESPEAVASYSLAFEVQTDCIYKNEVLIGYTERINNIYGVMKQNFSQKKLSEHNYLPIQSILFERNLYETLGGFDEDLEALEDWLLWNRYAKNNKFVYVEKATSMYRVPFCNLSNFRGIGKRKKEFDKFRDIVRERIRSL